MCGIMGYTGVKPAVPIIINGLERLEYRGYDSAGAAVINSDGVSVFKTVGSPERLREKSPSGEFFTGIGHTRWATHGAPTLENAHPHTSESGLFTVVHNGIIENFAELKKQLTEDGAVFTSETDTEVIAHLLERNYTGDVRTTLNRVLPMLEGSYALGILCRDLPDTLFCARMKSPLFVLMGADCGCLASDAAAISDFTGKIYRLGDGEIGILTKDSFRVFDTDGCRIRKTEIKAAAEFEKTDKNGYEHYMLKEIYEQPDVVMKALGEIVKDGRIRLSPLRLTKEKVRKLNRIEFIACGSAYHAGLAGAYVSGRLSGIPSYAYIASEYKSRNTCPDENTLCVFISQSGETADTVAALREANGRGAMTAAIVNNTLSTAAQESRYVVPAKAGREIAVATTKAYSVQLAVIYALCIKIGYYSGGIDKARYAALCEELLTLPSKILSCLENVNQAKEIADMLKNEKYVLFIGRGLDYCSCAEGALKLKEVSYTHCESYAAGELKHGTISLIEEGTPVVAVMCDKTCAAKTLGNIKECKARGAKIIAVTGESIPFTPEDGDTVIKIKETDDLFSVSLSVIPMQLVAYYTALEKGCSIDRPKNLAKSVTVE